MRRSRVAVIGGGIGGLTAAGLLAKEGHEVALFEQGGTLGGKAQSVTVDGITLLRMMDGDSVQRVLDAGGRDTNA
jgi:1-hydroxycarotenoid 3,4-desaturase